MTGITRGDNICEEGGLESSEAPGAHRVGDLPFALGVQPARILRFKFCAKTLGLLGDESLAGG